jgi:hypothetical protein
MPANPSHPYQSRMLGMKPRSKLNIRSIARYPDRLALPVFRGKNSFGRSRSNRCAGLILHHETRMHCFNTSVECPRPPHRLQCQYGFQSPIQKANEGIQNFDFFEFFIRTPMMIRPSDFAIASVEFRQMPISIDASPPTSQRQSNNASDLQDFSPEKQTLSTSDPSLFFCSLHAQMPSPPPPSLPPDEPAGQLHSPLPRDELRDFTDGDTLLHRVPFIWTEGGEKG